MGGYGRAGYAAPSNIRRKTGLVHIATINWTLEPSQYLYSTNGTLQHHLKLFGSVKQPQLLQVTLYQSTIFYAYLPHGPLRNPFTLSPIPATPGLNIPVVGVVGRDGNKKGTHGQPRRWGSEKRRRTELTTRL